jgi:hypothetical protein
MRMFPAFAVMGLLAATPCMAQVVITDGNHDAARHEYRADQQDHAAKRDEVHARQDAAMGDRRAAAHEQAEAQQHAAIAQHQEHRADQDKSSGVHVDIGR